MPVRDPSGLRVTASAWLVLAVAVVAWAVGLAFDGSGVYAAAGATLAVLVGVAGLVSWGRSREGQRRMLSGLVDGLIATAPDGRILEVNAAFCALVGQNRAQLVGALPPYVFWPREVHASWEETWALWAHATPQAFDAHWVHRDGHSVTVGVQVAVALDRRGRVAQRVATARDVSADRALQDVLYAERDFSGAVLGAMRDGWAVTRQGQITDVNDELCRVTGFTRGELIGAQAPYPFWPPELAADVTALRDRILSADGGDFEITFCRKDGERFPAMCGARPAKDRDGTVLGYVTTIRDISAERLREDGLRALAETDPLTGVANRRTFEELLAGAVSAGKPVSVIMLDLNDFKHVNDEHGHPHGDETLRRAARAWEHQLRGEGDVLARVGGDEFAVVLRGCDLEIARGVGRRLRDALPHERGCGVGIAQWNGRETATMLVARADHELYADKATQTAERLLDPARLDSVQAAGFTATEPDAGLDEFTATITRLLGTSVSFVSLVGDEVLQVASEQGLGLPPRSELALPETFCRHVVATGRPLVMDDTDGDPLTPKGTDLRAYAGFPLTDGAGATIGAVCAADRTPRTWTSDELAVLEVVARQAGLHLRKGLPSAPA